MSPQRVRALADVVQHVGDEAAEFGFVDLAKVVDHGVLGLLEDVPRRCSRGIATPGAVLVVGGDGLVAVAAGLPRRVLRRFALVDDAGLFEDGLVVLGGGDVLVGLPHAGVDSPADAVFDLASCVALATHPADGGVPEVVGVDRPVDVRPVGDALQLVSQAGRRERAVVVPWLVATAGDLVEESDVVPVRSGVCRPEVVPDRRRRVDQRVVLDVRPLQAGRVRVGSKGRPLTVEVDIADAERAGERPTDASVGEELDQGDVAEVVRALDQGLDVLGVEHLVTGRRVGISDADDVVVVAPVGLVVAMDPLQELPDGVLDVLGGGVTDPNVVAHPVFGGVSEIVDVLVELELVHRSEGTAHPVGSEADVLEVTGERRGRQAAVLLRSKLLDVTAVGLVMLVEFLELRLQTIAVASEIVEGHDQPQSLAVQKPQVWESNVLRILRFGKEPLSAGRSTLSPTVSPRRPVVPAETQGVSA